MQVGHGNLSFIPYVIFELKIDISKQKRIKLSESQAIIEFLAMSGLLYIIIGAIILISVIVAVVLLIIGLSKNKKPVVMLDLHETQALYSKNKAETVKKR